MSAGQNGTTSGRPSRRVLAQGAGWTVPAIVVGAPASATAASGGTGSVQGVCGPGRTGSFVLDVHGISTPYVHVVFTHSGAGTFAVVVPSGWLPSSGTTYLAPVTSGHAQGTAQITFTLGQNSTGTVTAQISATSGRVITGTRIASITTRRVGNSSNYTCTTS